MLNATGGGDMFTAAVMAGGKSSRMGRDKLLIRVEGETLVGRTARVLAEGFDTVLLCVADAEKYDTCAEPVEDVFRGCGPLGGLHAALLRTQDRGVFACAGDMPFISAEAALKVVEACGEAEACVPVGADGKPEPLFAYYKKELAPRAEELLREGRRSMRSLLEISKVKTIPAASLGDPHLLENLNTPEDLAAAFPES
jgi:molybdopterin-guanine dinucleotide biosynthesis protein A